MGVAYRPTQSKGSFHQLLMIMGSKSLYLLLFLTIFAPCLVLANPWSHSSSSSSSIHSNDTFTLELAENQDLHGAPGSFHRLKFLLKNNEYRRTYFIVNQETEDGFQGRIDDNEFSVGSSDQHTINVDLTVPQAKEGLKLIYTLTARKEDRNYRRKREEDPNRPGPGPVGGSSGYPGGSSGYPGGSSNNNPGGSSGYPGGSSNNNPGGSSNYNPGGSSNYNPGGSSNNNPGGSSNYNPGGWQNNPGWSDQNPGGSSHHNHNNNSPDWNDDPHWRDQSGKPNAGLSKKGIYAVVGASVGVLLIIIIVVVVVVGKKRYSRVSQNP